MGKTMYTMNSMKFYIALIIGKLLRFVAKMRGGGSALPGLLIERLDPHYLSTITQQLPHGVVVITGTNGKTTTTKTVVELLESQGMRVFSNKTGSNFVRGVIAASLDHTTLAGTLKADIAVLELDEAHAVHFIKKVKPTYSLLLNVLRDQLDRFGEIDTTASFLQKVAEATTDTVVVNCDDPFIGTPEFVKDISASVHGYGVSDHLLSIFESDNALHDETAHHTPLTCGQKTTLTDIDQATLSVTYPDQKTSTITTQLKGVYNLQNATGALALCHAILGKNLNYTTLHTALEGVKPAFGRGEVIQVKDQPLELILVKNPSGFKLSLHSFSASQRSIMIAINDEYADGRDMSWLWDVDFSSLRVPGVHTVTGARSYDMTLRLKYDEITPLHTEPTIEKAIDSFIANTPDQPRQIFCTYTSMIAIRKHLRTYAKMENIS